MPAETASSSHGSGLAVRRLRDDARQLSAAEFAERHGPAFLLLTAAELTEPHGPGSTEVRLIESEERAGERTASLSLLAYPIRRRGEAPGHLLTVGRASNNDVVIRDLSISRFHAFLKPEGEGRLAIQDARSTNGTTINGHPVPAQGNGEAVPLRSGDNLRLGQVELTFLTADAMQEFVSAHDR
jgi:hypothetical protein